MKLLLSECSEWLKSTPKVIAFVQERWSIMIHFQPQMDHTVQAKKENSFVVNKKIYQMVDTEIPVDRKYREIYGL